MDFISVMTILLLIGLVIFVTFYKPKPPKVREDKKTDDVVPATWNLDWEGGPGRDRYIIMNECGPYNMENCYM
jgi:hypothetical protein